MTEASTDQRLPTELPDIADELRRLRERQVRHDETARAYEALAQSVRQKEALYQLTDRLQQARSFDDIYDAALIAIIAALGCDRASILLFDDRNVMRFVAWQDLSDSYRKAVEGHSPWSRDEVNPVPICVDDIESADLSEELKATIRSEGIGAAAFIPLVCDGKLIGKFMTYYDAPHVFSKDEIELSLTIARQLAFGIERRRNEEALAAELADTKLLHAISMQLIDEENVDELYGKILDAAVTIMRSDYASMQRLYPERGLGGELRLLAFRGFNPQAAKFWEWVRADSASTCGEALRTATRVIAEDVDTCRFMQGTEDLAVYHDTGIRSVQTTPLVSRAGKLVGTISTHWRVPHQSSERDLRLFDILARQAADLIERRRAQETLQDTDRRKDEFLATLSHELRNPLAPIRQAAQLLKMPGIGEREAHWARDVIDRQVRALGWLLDDLLDLSRISRGKLELRRETVDLAEVVASAVEVARPMIDAKRHTLTLALPEKRVRFNADPLRLAQIISNLLTNAAKYTDSPGQIDIWARVEESEIVIGVRDNGIGIDAEVLPTVFEMFSQAVPALERTEGGLGIGLALVRGFAALHGGSVHAHSAGPGRGSEFTLRLPLGLPSTPPAVSVPLVVTAPEPSGRCKVLVVDDNRDTAETLAAVLQMQGYDVRYSFNGQEALSVAETFRPDIALLDIGMPHLNGYEAAQHLRKYPWGKSVTLIAVTGWGQEEDRRRAMAAGFDFHVRKPVDFEVLQSLLVKRENEGRL